VCVRGQGVYTRLFTSAERQSLHSCGRVRYSKQSFVVIGQLGRQTWWVVELSFWQLSSWSSLARQVSEHSRQQCSQLPSINTHFTTCYRCITWAGSDQMTFSKTGCCFLEHHWFIWLLLFLSYFLPISVPNLSGLLLFVWHSRYNSTTAYGGNFKTIADNIESITHQLQIMPQIVHFINW